MNTGVENVQAVVKIRTVLIPAGKGVLNGELTLPKGATGLVVLIQGDDRNHPHAHNNAVAKACHRFKLATLRIDFQLFSERYSPEALLSERAMGDIALWLQNNLETSALLPGVFASGTSVSYVFRVAALRPHLVKTLVLCGGRPDTTMELLSLVKAPVLLIAGGGDHESLHAYQAILEKLKRDSTLHVIPRASNSFEEFDSMEEAAQLAALWFSRHLG